MRPSNVNGEAGFQTLRIAAIHLQAERPQQLIVRVDNTSGGAGVKTAWRVVREIEDGDRSRLADRVTSETIVAEYRDRRADLRCSARRRHRQDDGCKHPEKAGIASVSAEFSRSRGDKGRTSSRRCPIAAPPSRRRRSYRCDILR